MCARATTETPRAERAARLLEERSPLRGRFSPKRWRHTLSVAETAHRLAKVLEWDPADRERALVAALLHDVAKELPPAEQRRLAGEAPEKAFSGLLHAAAGARLAEIDFGIHDEQVLQAIALHPTASPDPSPLVRLIFVADYLEPTRRHLGAADRDLLERALKGDLGLGPLFCAVLHAKIGHMMARGLALHPRSVASWNAHCAESLRSPETSPAE